MTDRSSSDSSQDLTIVGLGASAGGLEAATAFFDQMPRDTGLAFVMITHQHPGHVSLMPELLGRHTAVPVLEATDGTLIEPDHVYLSPPGAKLAVMAGTLHDMRAELETQPDSPTLPIDYFFRSLAEEARERAIAVILSGSGSDGSVGAKIVKRESGVVMAEDPETAAYDGMPRSVIATGVVDHVDTARGLGRKVVAYSQHRSAEQNIPPGNDPSFQDISKVFVLLRDHTGHDFSSYKENTVRRRMDRRMNLHQIDTPRDYVHYLQRNPAELDILFKELLIGVTHFFRDPDAFAALAAALPRLLDEKPDGETVRVWVPACSTGEEAYSIAMLFQEVVESLPKRLTVQIFATDLDPSAIDFARSAVYPEGIAVDVGKTRLRRFFVREDSSYRVLKKVRDTVVFALQNVITDPPFTKLELLSCRNLLIYLDGDLQQRLLPLFHYALNPGGLLFLGTSESIGTSSELFTPVDKKWKLFERAAVSRHSLSHLALRGMRGREMGVLAPASPRRAAPSLTRMIERLLIAEHVPPSIVVNERGTIVHIHGRIGLYFEPAPGQPSLNALDMAREGLQPSLASCLRRASAQEQEVRYEHLRVSANGGHVLVDLCARRVTEPEQLRGLILLTLRQRSSPGSESPPPEPGEVHRYEATGELEALTAELRYTKETLETTIEELETSNEALQSTNEELQSTNEELETSKEEMQSLNEELYTVNSELENKVTDLSEANDDLTNLLNGTEIATVFLDRELRVKRFTRSATKVIKLIRTDVGRPIGDLASELRYDSLVADAQEVLRTLREQERELKAKDHAWFLMRLIPYRTADNVIDGLIMTFVDITGQKHAEAAAEEAGDGLRQSEATLRAVMASNPVRVTVARVDRELRYTWVYNPHPDFGESEMLGKRDDELFAGQGAALELLELKRRVLERGESQQKDFVFELSDGPHAFRISAEPMLDASGAVAGVATVAIDLSELKKEPHS